MEYLRKFATEADIANVKRPGVVLVGDTGNIKYYKLYANGVYIQHTNGELYTSEEWTAGAFTNAEANGVAVVSNECSFVIAKTLASSSSLYWGGGGLPIDGIEVTGEDTAAVLDFDGAGNTSKIIEQLSGYTDSSGIVGAPAAEACANYTFPNGQNGYLPSCGEWNTVCSNKSVITSAMTLIGGSGLTKSYYWTSSLAVTADSWMLKWSSLRFSRAGRSNSSASVLAFTTLE